MQPSTVQSVVDPVQIISKHGLDYLGSTLLPFSSFKVVAVFFLYSKNYR